MTAVPIVVESTTAEYFVLYVRHDLDGTEVELPVLVKRGEAGTTTLAENVEALPAERYKVEKYLIAAPADADGDGIDDITELNDLGTMNPVNPAPAIDSGDGAVAVPDRETFETLSFDNRNTSHVKFVVRGMDTDQPLIYFQNTSKFLHHPSFLQAIGLRVGEGFKGSIIYDPNLTAPDGSLGMYRFSSMRLSSVDSFNLVARTYTLLAASMPLLENNLAVWIQNSMLPTLQSDLQSYTESRMHLLFDEDVFSEISFRALNPGEGYGRLRALDADERPHPRDVVIYEALPNELSRVAGIISTVGQTPLSHVNLRAAQNSIPNAYIRDALDDPGIAPLIGGYVRYRVAEGGWELRAATIEEVNAHYEASRTAQTQIPERDLLVTSITPLSDIGFEDWDSFGVKAANLAVLRTLGFPGGTVPDGFAIPFYFYDEFMKHHGFYTRIETMLDNTDFQTDPEEQDDMLDDLRDDIEDADTPDWIIEEIVQMNEWFAAGVHKRYRSSTNNEDLPGFNGAGLYDSKSQKPSEDEDDLAKSLKEVFAGLWNFRAFTEREFHRIDHMAAAMGVLVHPSFQDELVNGVAVSFDPAYGTDGTFYVNSQIDEDLVTNPEAYSIPEEILLNSDGTYIVVANSNQVPRGRLLIDDAQLTQLSQHLTVIHDHFEGLYNPESGEPFAMEIEFKITSDNKLAIKQARPWVFNTADPFHIEKNTTDALTATFHDPPATHDGNAFSVRVRFSERLSIGYEEFRYHALEVTGGRVTDADRLNGLSSRWRIRVTPDSDADVRLSLAAKRPCTIPYAICTADGRQLSTPVEHTVKGPPPPPPRGGGGGSGGGGAPRTSAPGAPRNLTAAGGDGQAVLTWDAPASDGGAEITDYEYRINGRGPWISIGSTLTTHTVTGLVNGTEYTFQVRAVNAAGRRGSSNRIEAKPEVFTLDFAHFANGALITSDLVFVNVVGTHPIRPALYFYDQEGQPIAAESVVDITDDLEIQEDGSLSVLTAMEPLGELTISTHGQGELVSGSVKVVSYGPIGGLLRFDLPGIGVAGVGASPPVRDAVFPVRRQEGGINTGVAIHNLESSAELVRCELMREGVLHDAVSIPLAANGQSSWFINEVFTGADTSDFAGSVHCDAAGPGMFTAVALELDAANRIFTTLPVLSVRRAGGRAAELNFAHFANGAGLTSDLVFLNLSTERSRPAPTLYHQDILPVRPAIYFYDTEGALVSAESVVDITGDLAVMEDGGLTVQTEMEPLGVLTIATHGRGELVSGSVRVIADEPIGGVLRFDLPGIGIAGVGASSPLRDALFPVRRQEGGINTGVAVHNLGEEAMEVTCELMQGGTVLDDASIPLAANGQSSWFINEVFTGAATSDFAGSVRCTAPGEGIFTGVAVELDAVNRIFTTLPVVPVPERTSQE